MKWKILKQSSNFIQAVGGDVCPRLGVLGSDTRRCHSLTEVLAAASGCVGGGARGCAGPVGRSGKWSAASVRTGGRMI